MGDNLVKRLRDWQHVHPEDEDKPEGHLYEEAADRIEELEAERDLQTERLRLAIERAEKAEGERDALRAELRGLWEARINRSGPVVDTILGVPLEDIFEKIICVAEEGNHESEKTLS